VGKVATKALRNAGAVPCVLYGGDQPVTFFSRRKAFKSLVYLQTHTVVIELEKENHLMLFYKTFSSPVSDKIYIDFFQFFDDKEITMEVPVKL
jgi:large subunit ribosomal protein L25